MHGYSLLIHSSVRYVPFTGRLTLRWAYTYIITPMLEYAWFLLIHSSVRLWFNLGLVYTLPLSDDQQYWCDFICMPLIHCWWIKFISVNKKGIKTWVNPNLDTARPLPGIVLTAKYSELSCKGPGYNFRSIWSKFDLWISGYPIHAEIQ